MYVLPIRSWPRLTYVFSSEPNGLPVIAIGGARPASRREVDVGVALLGELAACSATVGQQIPELVRDDGRDGHQQDGEPGTSE
jgi:hypothetical protein